MCLNLSFRIDLNYLTSNPNDHKANLVLTHDIVTIDGLMVMVPILINPVKIAKDDFLVWNREVAAQPAKKPRVE